MTTSCEPDFFSIPIEEEAQILAGILGQDACRKWGEYFDGEECRKCSDLFPGCIYCSPDQCLFPFSQTCNTGCSIAKIDSLGGDTCQCPEGEAWVSTGNGIGYCTSCENFKFKPTECPIVPHGNNPASCYGCANGYGVERSGTSLTCLNCDILLGTEGCASCDPDKGICTRCIEGMMTWGGKCIPRQRCDDVTIYKDGHLLPKIICNTCKPNAAHNIHHCVHCGKGNRLCKRCSAHTVIRQDQPVSARTCSECRFGLPLVPEEDIEDLDQMCHVGEPTIAHCYAMSILLPEECVLCDYGYKPSADRLSCERLDGSTGC